MTLSSCDLDTLPSTSLGEDIAITTESDLKNAVNGIGYLLSEDRMTYGADFGIYADLLTNEFKYVKDNGHSTPISKCCCRSASSIRTRQSSTSSART